MCGYSSARSYRDDSSDRSEVSGASFASNRTFLASDLNFHASGPMPIPNVLLNRKGQALFLALLRRAKSSIARVLSIQVAAILGNYLI